MTQEGKIKVHISGENAHLPFYNGNRFVMDAGGTRIRFGFVNEAGAVESESFKSRNTAQSIFTRYEFCDLIVDLIRQYGGIQKRHALSVAGPVSNDYRVIRKYTNVLRGDMNIPVSEMVEGRIRETTGREIELFVIKDAVAATLAEMGRVGAASDRDEAIAIILGTGTGGALCKRLNNGTFIMPDALADVGHHIVNPMNMEKCNCGSVGCVELHTSGTGVVRNFNNLAHEMTEYFSSILYGERGIPPGSISGEDIAWAAGEGDKFTINILGHAAESLAILLRNIFTSHPQMTIVLVGGFALGVGTPLLDLVRKSLIKIGIPFLGKGTDVENYVKSRVLLGTIPPEYTNLVGARIFLMEKEKCG